MSLLLFGNDDKSVKKASQIIKETIGFEKVEGVWYVIFSTVENRKGYGKQKVPVSEFSEFVEVLQEKANNGIQKEDEIPSCAETVRKSIIQSEDGSIRFKTESTKGKKPTLFSDLEDFQGAVEMLASVQSAIASKAETLK
jgi:hypothetical protein